jgi:hypothetical protein
MPEGTSGVKGSSKKPDEPTLLKPLLGNGENMTYFFLFHDISSARQK